MEPTRTPDPVADSQLQAQRAFYAEKYGNKQARADGSFFPEDSVNAWLMRRLHCCADPLLGAYPGAHWLTVGDGRFGRDAHYLESRGARVIASDISGDLLARAQSTGYIREYRQASAEALPFADGAFDFVFCKHSYHHFPRPMLAVYEMLRVSRIGVLLIEPTEVPLRESAGFVAKRLLKSLLLRTGLGGGLRTADTSILRAPEDLFEPAGNYMYALSERAMTQLAIAVNLPSLATRYMYAAGRGFRADEPATPELIAQLEAHIRRSEHLVRSGINRHAPEDLALCLFKVAPNPAALAALARGGYTVRQLPRNPHLPAP